MNLFRRDPLTHRLAVPPLPQGEREVNSKPHIPLTPKGERAEIFSDQLSVVSTLSFLGQRDS
jgi:hypothetical protein